MRKRLVNEGLALDAGGVYKRDIFSGGCLQTEVHHF